MKKILKINIKKILVPIFGAFLFGATIATPLLVSAAPHGFGAGQGRTDTININDFSTSVWDRFTFNYQFTSGMNYREDLGRPTTFMGDVRIDPFTVNIRRDANVSLFPPAYGVFSGNVATMPSNLLFEQPNMFMALQFFFTENPHILPRYDTLQLGVNARGNGTALLDTSMGELSLELLGASNITNNIHGTSHDMNNTNSNSSSIVTFPVSNEIGSFLTPTSIR